MLTEKEKRFIALAHKIIARRLIRTETMTGPELMREYLFTKFAVLEHEVFLLILLDNQHRIIEAIEISRGTIDQASVYPREVVKTALQYNAAVVMLAHNHPSGVAEPSRADRQITERLQTALGLVDIRVLDHFVVGGETIISFAERGYL
jgi:DNA repair protein RadC